MSVVDRDLDNFRAAHRWMIDAGQVDLALQTCPWSAVLHALPISRRGRGLGRGALDLPGAEQHPLFAEVCGAVGEGLTARGEMAAALAWPTRLDQLADPTTHDGCIRCASPAWSPSTSAGSTTASASTPRCSAWHGCTTNPTRRGWRCSGWRSRAPTPGTPIAAGLRRGAAARGQAARQPVDAGLGLVRPGRSVSSIDPARAIEPYQRAIDSPGPPEALRRRHRPGRPGLAAGPLQEPGVALPAVPVDHRRWRRMGVWHHQWTTLRNLVQLFMRIGNWEPQPS